MITRAPTGSRVRRGGRTRAGCSFSPPSPVGRRTQAAPGGLFHNTLRFRGVVPGKTGRCHTGLVTRPITPIRCTGRRETNRPRSGPVAGHVSGTFPLMPASHAVGCARPRTRPSAVVRRTRRRGGAGRGLTGCARPRGPAASRLTATRAPRATPMCRSIRASAHAICTPAATVSVGSTTGSPRHPEHGSHPRRVLRRCETARAGGGWCRSHRDHRRGVGAVPGDRALRRSCWSRRRRDRRVTAGGSSEVTPLRMSSRDRAPRVCRRRLTSPSWRRHRAGEPSG